MRPPLPGWRSLLFVPVTAERYLARAHLRGADALILDLEDAIPPAERAAARAALPGAVALAGQAGPTGAADVCVRINRPLDQAVADIAAAVRPGVAALLLPKLMGPEHLRLLAEVVTAREAVAGLPPGQIRLVGQVETPAALFRLEAIAAAEPRLVALGLGGEDLATELEAEPTADLLHPLGVLLVAAARAAGVLPMGSVGAFADFTDLDGYRAGLRRSRRLGFACCACIHPAQVAIINEEYGVTAAEAQQARRLIAAAEAADGAAVALDGRMVDLPVVERARRLLTRARQGTTRARQGPG